MGIPSLFVELSEELVLVGFSLGPFSSHWIPTSIPDLLLGPLSTKRASLLILQLTKSRQLGLGQGSVRLGWLEEVDQLDSMGPN